MTPHVPQSDRAQPEQPDTEAVCREAASHEPDDPERLVFLDGLKTQIREGVYRPDIRDLARSLANMLVRDL